MKPSTIRFVMPQNAIQAEAAIDINAPPEQVAAVYRDVEKWGETFQATIEQAQITQTGDNWKQIQVAHKQEGYVPNTLIELSDTEIVLEESKKNFDASFLNRFLPATDGRTHYVIHASVRLKGIYRVLKPFLKGYVRRQTLKQMQRNVLEPLKAATEKNIYFSDVA